MRLLAGLSAVAALLGSVQASPKARSASTVSSIVENGIEYTVFNHGATGAKLQFVNNSGICETTKGVNQYSGYISVGEKMNMWFWFFEARKDPKTAPLSAWFNGGPGCSSMIGLFQENGPCHFVDGEKEPSLNEHSFNNFANMLYIDQPIGVGYSYGTEDVSGTDEAAPLVWKLIQAFYEQFPQYESRDFGIFTESYGGHYGPGFANYIQQQNKEVAAGSVEGEKIDLIALGVNNGLMDSKIQEKSYIDFAFNNTYRQLIDKADRDSYYETLESECLPALEKCLKDEDDDLCATSSQTCSMGIENPIGNSGDFNVYDVRAPANDPNPPTTYQDYLADPEIMKKIGAKSEYQDCASGANMRFSSTGDHSKSYLDELSNVVKSGIQVLVWAGDADWICNWYGNYDVANAVDYPGKEEFAGKDLKPYTVNGKEKGTFKNVENFSFLRVYEAGHMVMYYQPELSLQAFVQTMQKKPISST
ncbi:putative carboxypeptidase S1 [Aspergillus campestris IBT 28561]|uniref:Carboxypeptidase n=1 Tax=Aspergillus campestris (strain IBT 28561) TaxID=1392248 RepID=A0A2I1DCT1_ASPC2|nr:putative carboxypeptidase S1 [Aspergillus campestris IBT 28561]PKY07660.1 putative carboxypeptidase S1 [Aspergillus campestris IBT 28561]